MTLVSAAPVEPVNKPSLATAGRNRFGRSANSVQQRDESASVAGCRIPFFLQYEMVPLNWETLRIIFPFAIVLCGVGLIESLMTLTLIDEITETRGRAIANASVRALPISSADCSAAWAAVR